MKHTWRIRRQTSPQMDGQQRWDRAYQLLLQWSQAPLAPREQSCDPYTKLNSGDD